MTQQDLKNNDEFGRDRSQRDPSGGRKNPPDTRNPGRISEPPRSDDPSDGGSGRTPGPQGDDDDR